MNNTKNMQLSIDCLRISLSQERMSRQLNSHVLLPAGNWSRLLLLLLYKPSIILSNFMNLMKSIELILCSVFSNIFKKKNNRPADCGASAH